MSLCARLRVKMPLRSGHLIRALWHSLVVTVALCASACGQQVNSPELERLRALGPGAAVIDDYVSFFTGSALFDSRRFAEAVAALEPVLTHAPASPVRGRAAELAARAQLESGDFAAAATTAQRYAASIGQPQASVIQAKAAVGLGDLPGAARFWQFVYVNYPAGAEAAEAASELAKLRSDLGERFPEPSRASVFARVERLAARGRFDEARADLQAVGDDTARIRACAIDSQAGRNAQAYACLRQLSPSAPAAAAERLYWLVITARRLNRDTEMLAWTTALARYPASEWRLKALVAAANQSLLDGKAPAATQLYRTCAAAFAESSEAPGCHWKYVWLRWMARAPDARKLMREHAARFPLSDKVPAALYFAGARQAVIDRFPTSYYAVLARKSVAGNSRARTAEPLDWTPNAAARIRTERARVLSAAGFDDFALGEFRFAARNDEAPQPHVLAFELARLAASKQLPERGIRGIKAIFPDYIHLPPEAAPQEFWELAFPMVYRETVEREARSHAFDPFLLAALIRQESEFDRTVVSPARAYGLMQLLPSTAAELARRADIEPFSRDLLFDAGVNVRLGTLYFAGLVARFDGNVEAALASYNGGAARVRQWLTWWNYREPAEFVESIPISETRNYVLLIRRNEDFYRRIYSRSSPAQP